MYLYILESLIDGSHYVGITHDLTKRLEYHNSHRVKSTKKKAPWKLVYNERYNSIQEAREREKFLKSYKGVKEKREIIKNIVNKYSGIVPGRAQGAAAGRLMVGRQTLATRKDLT